MSKRRFKGSGSVFKRSNGYYVYKYIDANGNQKQKSLGTKNKSTALEKAKDFENAVDVKNIEEVIFQVAQAKKIISKKDLPIYDVWTEFIQTNPSASSGTLKNYERNLNEFVNWLSVERPSIVSFTQIELETANSYMEYIWSSTGVSPNTYNYKRGSMATITKALQNKFGINSNCWVRTERKKEVQQERLQLNSKHVSKLLDIIDNKNDSFKYPVEMTNTIKLCLFGGMRLIDAVNIKFKNFDFENDIISYSPIKTEKSSGGNKAILPMLRVLREAFENVDKTQSDYVVPNVLAHYNRNSDFIKKKLLEIIHSVTGDARNDKNGQCKINRRLYGIHSLRGTFATEMAKRGVAGLKLARMLGDKITTVDKYYIGADLHKKVISEYIIPCNVDSEREQMKMLADDLSINEVKEIIAKYGAPKQLK